MATTPIQPAMAEVGVDARSAAVGWRRRLRSGSLPAWLALAAVIAFGTVQTAVIFHNHHLGLLGDDYDFLLARQGLSVHTLLQPHNEHLVAVGVLLYRAIFALVGVSTAVPYIALLLVALAACAVLSYVFVRRELGPWLALIVPLLLVTLGPAAEALLWPFEFNLFSALAFWLGGMLLIKRGDARTDAVGCMLLILGVGSESIGVVLLPATAVALLMWKGWRKAWRSSWIVALPLVLYAAWYLVYQPHGERSLAKAPGFIVNSFVATVADISGVGKHSPYTALLAAALIAVVSVRCLYLRRVPSTTVYMSVGLLMLWLAAGLSEGPGRVPSESRYQFPNSLLLMLALAPLAPRLPLTPRLSVNVLKGGLLMMVVGVIVALNLGRYGQWEEVFSYQESLANAELAAVEVARPAIVNPGEAFTGLTEAGLFWPVTPRAYLDAVDAHGSPVGVRRDLELASPAARAQADVVLVRTEEISVAGRARIGTVRPGSPPGSPPLQAASPGCAVVPAGAASAGFQVVSPPGGLVIRPDAGPPVAVGIARFSDPPVGVALNPVLGASESELVPAHDSSSVPWRFQLTAGQAVTVCSGAE
jgi:hypothetical protein